MNYIDGFRDQAAARRLVQLIGAEAAALPPAARVTVMEVCGSHTMAIARYGIRGLLPGNVDLVSGPGCPVCVTGCGYIDAAVELARRGCALVTFGDMVNVPGSDTTLAAIRGAGAAVHTVYSPRAALDIARRNPGTEVVFLGVGFETTIPAVIGLIPQAQAAGIGNLSILAAFKLVPPALRALRADPELAISAFLCPAHVSAIIGPDAYREFAGEGGVPCVIAGFEPLDILLGMLHIVMQVRRGERRVENLYDRVVSPGGNPAARALMEKYLEPVDAWWRGIGVIPGSGLGIRAAYASFDAAHRHGISIGPGRESAGCRCGDVIRGKLQPPACPLFGTACTPETPVGPCMVSSEGTCSAFFKYGR